MCFNLYIYNTSFLLFLCFSLCFFFLFFFFSSRRRHTRCGRDWSSDVCSSDLLLYSGSIQVGHINLSVVEFRPAFLSGWFLQCWIIECGVIPEMADQIKLHLL